MKTAAGRGCGANGTAAEPSLAVTALMALNMALVQQGNPTGNSIPTLSTDTGERQLRWRP